MHEYGGERMMHEYGWRQDKFDAMSASAKAMIVASNHGLALEMDRVRGLTVDGDRRSLVERTIDAHVILVAFMNRGGRYPEWIKPEDRTPLARSLARCVARGWLSDDADLRLTQLGVEQISEMKARSA